MIRLRNMDRPSASSCSLRQNKSPRTSPNDQTTRATEIAPPSRQCIKNGIFLVSGAPVDSPERSTPAAPQTADSMGTCLAGPIILNQPSGRGSLHIPKSQVQEIPFFEKNRIRSVKTSWIDVLHALLHPDAGCRARNEFFPLEGSEAGYGYNIEQML